MKTKTINISTFNIKILPLLSDDEMMNEYSEMIKRLSTDEIAINTRGEKFMEVMTQYSTQDNKIIYGKLIYYTLLDGEHWYNRKTKELEDVSIPDGLFPNGKEVEYFFIPEAHRFSFRVKSGGVALSQVEKYLKEALPLVVGEGHEVVVSREITEDIIEKIVLAPEVQKIFVSLSYTNHDLSPEFAKLIDDDMHDTKVKELRIEAKGFNGDSIDLENTKLIPAALELSKSNGYALATITNVEGFKENISTVEYPRKDAVRVNDGSDHLGVYTKVMNLFRTVRRG